MQLSDAQLDEYRTLKNSGVSVENNHTIAPHTGQETKKHYHAKCAVAHIGMQEGYIVNTECDTGRGRADVILWGNPERLSYAVEIETDIQPGVRKDKLQQYVRETALDDMVLIEANILDYDLLAMYEQLRDELGL